MSWDLWREVVIRRSILRTTGASLNCEAEEAVLNAYEFSFSMSFLYILLYEYWNELMVICLHVMLLFMLPTSENYGVPF